MRKSAAIMLAFAVVAATASAKPKEKEGALDARNRSIVEISACTAVSDLGRLKKAVESAMDGSLSVSEIGEIMVQAYAYVGFPRSLLAQGILTQTVKEREDAGKSVDRGDAAKSIPQDLNRYDYGREKINTLFGMDAKQGRPEGTDYASATDIFLKEHLFADIFYRGILSDKERELATASMLGALGNVNPMFASHTAGALRNGNTRDELLEMADIIGSLVGKAQGKNAREVVVKAAESAR